MCNVGLRLLGDDDRVKERCLIFEHEIKIGAEIIGHEIKENTELAEHETGICDVIDAAYSTKEIFTAARETQIKNKNVIF